MPPTALELLWGATQRPKRGPKPALSIELIVSEAIALVDVEGLSNLSMQRLAERLGFTKMSLYRYVPGKAELTALMLDTALGPAPEALTAAQPADLGEPPRWRADLYRWAETIFQRYQAHPWAIELIAGPRPIGPNELSWLESALAAIAETGLTGTQRLDAVVLLNGHVRSLVQQIAATDGDASAQLAAHMAEAMAASGDRFPAARAAYAAETDQRVEGKGDKGDNALDFGIARILDGLEVFIDRRDRGIAPIVE